MCAFVVGDGLFLAPILADSLKHALSMCSNPHNCCKMLRHVCVMAAGAGCYVGANGFQPSQDIYLTNGSTTNDSVSIILRSSQVLFPDKWMICQQPDCRVSS